MKIYFYTYIWMLIAYLSEYVEAVDEMQVQELGSDREVKHEAL